MAAHDWVPSTLGHGETMCRNCRITNREAAVLGALDECSQLLFPKFLETTRPLTELEYDAYEPGGPLSGQPLPFDPVRSPGHTDLMMTPEAIDAALTSSSAKPGGGDRD